CTMPPERIVDAGNHAFAVLDAYPVSPGHTLVISRRHTPDIFDLTSLEVEDILRLVRSARDRINRSFQPAWYNVGVNVGCPAGQTVMHANVHVIPRYPGDSAAPAGGVRGVILGKAHYAQAAIGDSQ